MRGNETTMAPVIRDVSVQHPTLLSDIDDRSLASSRAQRMAANGSRISIGLLASYSGTNLGDGALYDAILMNLPARIPGATFYGINLFPKDTERRHGIPAFPITGLTVEWYSSPLTLFGDGNSPSRQQQTNGWHRMVDRVKVGVKKIPPLASGCRFILRRLSEAQNISREIRHLIRSYFFVRKLDLVVVSGSEQVTGRFGPWAQPYSVFRWALLAKLTRTPFAVTSVGTGPLEAALSRYFLRTALATACYRSFRDQESRDLLKAWRFTRDDPCVPDLAFSLDLSRYHLPDIQQAPTHLVAIGPMSYGKPGYWETDDPVTYDRYIDALTDFTNWLIQRGYRILLFGSSGTDRAAIADLQDRLGERHGQEALAHLAQPSIIRVEDLLREVSRAEFVVASRFHGVLLSHVLLKPVLAIPFEQKGHVHMQRLDQRPYSFDIRSVTARQLTESFASLETNATHVRAHVTRCINANRLLLDSQYEQLLRFATNHPIHED